MFIRFVVLCLGTLHAVTAVAAEGSCLRQARQVAIALCGAKR